MVIGLLHGLAQRHGERIPVSLVATQERRGITIFSGSNLSTRRGWPERDEENRARISALPPASSNQSDRRSGFQIGSIDNHRDPQLQQNAIETDAFEPFFQPQINAITGRLDGFEALARWRHPARGILSPRHFLYVAGQANLPARIDDPVVFLICIYLFSTSIFPKNGIHLSDLALRIEPGAGSMRHRSLASQRGLIQACAFSRGSG